MAVYAAIGKEVLLTSLILSDFHGNEACFRRVLALQKHLDYIFFLGDGYAAAERVASEESASPFVGVRGNCDIFSCGALDEMTLDLDGVRIFLHHGHTTSVKHGLGGACAAALRHEADICLFGHTHTPYLSYEQREGRKPFYLFNPGTIASGQFGIMEIRRGEILLSHGRL